MFNFEQINREPFLFPAGAKHVQKAKKEDGLKEKTTHNSILFDPRVIEFFGNKDEIAAVYAFGSHAAGRQRPESDVDIGILLLPECLGSAERMRQECMVQLGRMLRKDIHPVILNHAGEVLLKQVLVKGKAILVKNQKVDKYFKMVSLSRIVDFNYHLEKMQAGLTKKILES